MSMRPYALAFCSREFLREVLQLPGDIDAFYWDYDTDSLVLRLNAPQNTSPRTVLFPSLSNSREVTYQELPSDYEQGRD